MSFVILVIAPFTVLTCYVSWKIVYFVLKPQLSPLRCLRGPGRESLIWGNRRLAWREDQRALFERWEEEHGQVFVYKVLLNVDRVFISDLRAVGHVLTHPNVFQKPEQMRAVLRNIMGEGLLLAEGPLHKKQRRVLNPCFGPSSIRNLTPIFFDKIMKMQRIWESELGVTDIPKQIDVLIWLSRVTLDIIGTAGFNCDLGSLNVKDNPNELALVIHRLYHKDEMMSFGRLVRALVPLARYIPSKFVRDEHAAREKMFQAGKEMLQVRKNEQDIIRDSANSMEREHPIQEGGASELRVDLLSALVKANSDTDLAEMHRLSDEEVISQIPTFLVTGHETTAVEVAWALFSLSSHTNAQRRLHTEVSSCAAVPSADELGSLPYLDAVVRETLRLHPAIPHTTRFATEDVEIPVGKAYLDKNGVERSTIRMKKGEGLIIPILTINRSKAIWGDDSLEFKPERWFDTPKSASFIPGVFSNLMSFLGGARGCIAYRFAVMEIKAIIFALVRNFEFDLAVPAENIEKRCVIVARPFVRDEPDCGAQLPLLVRRRRHTEDVLL